MKLNIALIFFLVFVATSFALPNRRHHRQRQHRHKQLRRNNNAKLTINPFLLDVTPGKPKDNSAASLKQVCNDLTTALNKKLADCQGANKGTAGCNKLNGSPINQDAVDKHGKQCQAHTIKNGAFNADIFDNALPTIDQKGKSFAVGNETFTTLSDALIGACKQQRQQNLATLDDCTKNAKDAAKCKKLDGTLVTREEVNLHNSVCFSFHTK